MEHVLEEADQEILRDQEADLYKEQDATALSTHLSNYCMDHKEKTHSSVPLFDVTNKMIQRFVNNLLYLQLVIVVLSTDMIFDLYYN
jgi:hypothetical protein